MQFATPVYDFGKAKSGDLVKHEFIFTNTGPTTLNVSNVQPSCGCTTAGEWTREVEPGKTGIIPIQFNSAGYNGNVLKTITVTTSDKIQPTSILQLKGAVWKPVEVIPQFVMFNGVLPGSGTPMTNLVTIKNNMDDALDVWAPEINSKSFTAELKTNTQGKEYQLTIATVPPFEPGSIQGQVTVKSSSSNAPLITVSSWANIPQYISVQPPTITLPPGPLSVKQPVTLAIQNNSSELVKLSGLAVDAKGVDVQLAETQPGKTFTATLTFPEGFDLAAGTHAEFSATTSHPKTPVLKVQILQAPKPPTPAIVPLQTPPQLQPIPQPPQPGHAVVPPALNPAAVAAPAATPAANKPTAQ
jgi:hypothetical protein